MLIFDLLVEYTPCRLDWIRLIFVAIYEGLLMPQPLPKYLEINDELTDRLSSNDLLSEMEFRRYIKRIEALTDIHTQNYLYAMAYAAYGKKDKAIPFFEESLRGGVDVAPDNYLAYLNSYGSFLEVQELSMRWADTLKSKNYYFTAFQSCLFRGDIDKAGIFVDKYLTLADDEETHKIKRTFEFTKEEVGLFKERSGLSDKEFQIVAETVIFVIVQHNERPAGLAYLGVQEEMSFSYIVILKCEDHDKIAEMNIDLAFALADYDELTDKNFSAWFRGLEGVENVSFSY